MITPRQILNDPAFAFLAPALESAGAQPMLRGSAAWLADGRLDDLRISRHKPGRRCLIEYDVSLPTDRRTIIAKVRPKGTDIETFALMSVLRQVGFADDASDGVSVPAPIAIVHGFRLWLQEKVPGEASTNVLVSLRGVYWAGRIADALGKLHDAPLSPRRCHTIHDELAILTRQLAAVEQPAIAGRNARLIDRCCALTERLPAAQCRPIHRDFYPDHVLVAGERIYLLDFDLTSAGDPALDAGNFIGHLLELSIRCPDVASRCKQAASAFQKRFLDNAPGIDALTIQHYATLTLARHVAISQRIPERRAFTERILAACEARLNAAQRTNVAVLVG